MEIDFSKLPDQGSTGIDWAKLPDPGEKTTITQDIAGAISKGMEAISPAVVPFLAAGQAATQFVDWGIDKLLGRKEQETRPEVEDMSLENEIIRREGLGRNIPEYLKNPQSGAPVRVNIPQDADLGAADPMLALAGGAAFGAKIGKTAVGKAVAAAREAAGQLTYGGTDVAGWGARKAVKAASVKAEAARAARWREMGTDVPRGASISDAVPSSVVTGMARAVDPTMEGAGLAEQRADWQKRYDKAVKIVNGKTDPTREQWVRFTDLVEEGRGLGLSDEVMAARDASVTERLHGYNKEYHSDTTFRFDNGTKLSDETSPIAAKIAEKEAKGHYVGGFDPGELKGLELPEIVEMAREAAHGKYPRIKEVLRNDKGLLDPNIRGQFRLTRTREIWLKAGIFDDTMQASRVLAHELGHWIDDVPGSMINKRGNILGRIASSNRYWKQFLEEFPGAPPRELTADEIELLKSEATRQAAVNITPKYKPEDILNVWNNLKISSPELVDYIKTLSSAQKVELTRAAMKGSTPAWFKFNIGSSSERVQEILGELIEAELRRRGGFDERDIRRELIALSAEWRPWDRALASVADPGYLRYRDSSVELYADAFSALINDPKYLKDKAPTFYRAFFNWLERKPKFKEEYLDMQKLLASTEVGIKRDERTLAGYGRGTAARAEMEKLTNPFKGLSSWLKNNFIDVNMPLIQKQKDVESRARFRAGEAPTFFGKNKIGFGIEPEMNPRYWLEELPYVSGHVHYYLRKIDNRILKPMEKYGIDETEMGLYMHHNRAATELSGKAVAHGESGKYAVEALDRLRQVVGDEKFGQISNLAKEFQRIREEEIIPLLEKSNAYSPALMKHIKDNKNYATYNVVDYMEANYGRENSKHFYQQLDANLIRRLKGNLGDVANPFIETAIKDAALIRGANVKMAKEAVIKMFLNDTLLKNEIKPTSMVRVTYGKGKTSTIDYVPSKTLEKGEGVISYLHQGKQLTFIVPEEIAKSFARNPYESGAIAKALQYITMPLKAVFVSHNPAWALMNIRRDIRSFAQNVPEATLYKAVKAMYKAFPETVAEMSGKLTKTSEEMYRGNMLVVDRIYSLQDMAPTSQMDGILMKYGASEPKYYTNVLKPFTFAWDLLGYPSKFSERWTKIAGYKFLKENTDYTEKEIAHLVRSRIGTPDMMRAGIKKQFYNNVFIFSNIGKEGLRSSFEAAKDSPATYLWKMAKYNVIPKAAMMAATLGYLGPYYMQMMKDIPEYDKANYMCVPLYRLPEEHGKQVVYMVIPHDFQGQYLGGIMWKMWNKVMKPKEVHDDLYAYLSGGIPWMNVNPLFMMGARANSYMSDINPKRSYGEGNMVSDKAWDARLENPWWAREQVLKQMSSDVFGSAIYRYRADTPGYKKHLIEKVLGLPMLGTALSKFVRVSNRGWEEQNYLTAAKTAAVRANEDLTIGKIVDAQLDNEAKGMPRKHPDEIWADLIQRGIVKHKLYPGTQEAYNTAYREFKESYAKKIAASTKNPNIKALLNAKSTEARGDLLMKMGEANANR